MVLVEDYNLIPERDSDSICGCGVTDIALFI